MIDDVQIEEPPADIGPVSREEAQGMWRQLDMLRIAQQSAATDLADTRSDIGALLEGSRTLKAGVFLLLLWNVAEAVLATQPAQAMLAMVAP